MLKLEEIAKEAQITGLVPDEVVKVVNVEEIGPSARLVAYRNAQGKLDEQTIFRHDEHRLSLAVAGKAWAFDAAPAAFKLALEAYRISLAHLFDPLMRSPNDQGDLKLHSHLYRINGLSRNAVPVDAAAFAHGSTGDLLDDLRRILLGVMN